MRRSRRKQVGGTAVYTPTLKQILTNAAAGVLNKQKRRIMGGVKKRKENVKKPWIDMGKESGAIKQRGGNNKKYITYHISISSVKNEFIIKFKKYTHLL